MSKLSPILRTAGVSALAVGSVFALSGCGAIVSAITGAVGGGPDNVMQLRVGDCFIADQMGTGDTVSGIPVIDCAQEHDSEFYYAHQMADGEFPGREAANTEAEEVCLGENFTNFVGVPYSESEIYAGYLTPTQQTWDQMNDREILCYVTTANNGQMVTGTLEDANR